MREKILTFIEKNSRIDLKELAIVLGVDETTVMNELEKMEEETLLYLARIESHNLVQLLY